MHDITEFTNIAKTRNTMSTLTVNYRTATRVAYNLRRYYNMCSTFAVDPTRPLCVKEWAAHHGISSEEGLTSFVARLDMYNQLASEHAYSLPKTAPLAYWDDDTRAENIEQLNLANALTDGARVWQVLKWLLCYQYNCDFEGKRFEDPEEQTDYEATMKALDDLINRLGLWIATHCEEYDKASWT